MVNRNLNNVFIHTYEPYKLGKLTGDQRLGGVVESLPPVRAVIVGSNPIQRVLFFPNLENFKMLKKG